MHRSALQILLYLRGTVALYSCPLPLFSHSSPIDFLYFLQPDMVDHACNPSTQEAETEKPRDYEIKASLGLNSHLKASLDYIKKKKKKLY